MRMLSLVAVTFPLVILNCKTHGEVSKATLTANALFKDVDISVLTLGKLSTAEVVPLLSNLSTDRLTVGSMARLSRVAASSGTSLLKRGSKGSCERLAADLLRAYKGAFSFHKDFPGG